MDEKQRILTVPRRISLILTLLVLIITLAGCATTKAPVTTKPLTAEETKQRETLLANLQNWQLSGKVAAISAQDSGSASIDWTQRGPRYHISLMGPLGSHAVKLQGQPGLVTMDTADGKHASAPNAETLLAQQMGWRLPVSNLNYWIRGLPVPTLPQNSAYDASHRLTRLVQDGWNIQYINYQNVGSIDLPERININSNSLKVKIIVYKWTI